MSEHAYGVRYLVTKCSCPREEAYGVYDQEAKKLVREHLSMAEAGRVASELNGAPYFGGDFATEGQ